MSVSLKVANACPYEATVVVDRAYLLGPWGSSPAPMVSCPKTIIVKSDFHSPPLGLKHEVVEDLYGGLDGQHLTVIAGGVGLAIGAPANRQTAGAISVEGAVETEGKRVPFEWSGQVQFFVSVEAPNVAS